MKSTLLFLAIFFSSFTFCQTVDELIETAYSQINKNDFKSALKTIDNALKTDPKNVDCYLVKSEILFSLQDYKTGYDMFSIALTIEPKNSSIYANRAFFLERIQRFDSAIEDDTKAIEFAENDTLKHSYYCSRAAVKSQIRDFQGAYDDLMISYAFDSTNVATLTNLGAVCDEVGKGDETFKYLFKIIEIDSTFIGAYANIGYKYQNMGQHDKAIEYYNKVLELSPNEPLGYSNRSFSRLKTGDLKGAMQDIEKSIKLYPSNSYAFKIRALIYLEKEKTDEACEDLKTAAEMGYTQMYGEEVKDLQKKYCK